MKRQSERRVQQLLNTKKLAALKRLHEKAVEGIPEDKKVTVQILIQRADPSILYHRADNIDGDGHYICRAGGENGTRREYAYIVSKSGEMSKAMTWERGDRHFVIGLFFNAVACEDTAYLLWVTHEDWYAKPTPEEEEARSLLERHVEWEITYTVYLPPKQGFRKLLDEADITKNVELTERMLIVGCMNHEPEYEAVVERLGKLAQEFERRVYNTGLKKIIHASKMCGMSGNFGGVEVMSWVMCARVMITMEALNPHNPRLHDSFTIMGNEPPGTANFGELNILATADRAAELVQLVIKGWESIPIAEHATRFAGNGKVKLAGI